MWVTVWVRQLTHILTHTISGVFATKKHRKPKFSMLFGAGGVTRTHDLLITKCIGVLRLTVFRDFGAFPLGILREVRPILSIVFVRSFPRVGHGVGQSHRHRQCGSTFSGSGMVTFCAAGNNERVSKRRHRATGRSAMLPPGGSAGFPYGSKCGSNLFQLIKKRRQHIVDDRTYDSPVGILVMMH